MTVFKKYDVFYSSEIPKVTWYEQLYNDNLSMCILGVFLAQLERFWNVKENIKQKAITDTFILFILCENLWQKPLGSARSASTALSYRSCFITWLAAVEDMVLHVLSHAVWWNKNLKKDLFDNLRKYTSHYDYDINFILLLWSLFIILLFN